MRYADLHCVRCGKGLEPSADGWGDNTPPHDALLFISYGNYGSTVYDPQGSGQEYLLVVLCDDCALVLARKRDVMHICKPLPVPAPPPRSRGPWVPDGQPHGDYAPGGARYGPGWPPQGT